MRGTRLSRWLGRAAFAGLGWRFAGVIPDVEKAVVIVAPHTSNWDFVVGVAAMFALGIRVVFLGKHTLFRWPLGPVMRWLGGIPVDRRVSTGVVGHAVRMFAERDRMILALAPEGTRRPVERWKTGFHRIAQRAGVPIVPVAFDWSRRRIRFGDPVTPSGDLGNDVRALQSFYTGAGGRRRGAT
jgi:1-acyl-sn-glycerol-3-phosphate acyltransferase